MPAYAIAHLRNPAPHTDIAEYIERLPETLAPHGGRYLVHMKEHEVKEGSWPGAVVILGFPGLAEARAWWDSPAYQEIAPLRSRHIDGDIIIVEGVADDYTSTAAAQAMRASLADA
ncbi:DUF1330 domain-containing protein [Nocardia brasiliensis]|uniref:DUF1330 domain-containing protein n=1 Tax=Nocardia brasiliensis TaxID=37326 RepID=A0A6G9Y170_NOCBR|nr:DUF1330 domain-containing protein [Nocardia brasiliensis]QIS06959.1 DUF1330 domain-containing protein [Nocardia brasiliensis]